MGWKVVLRSPSCSQEQQNKLLKEIVGVKGFGKVVVDFPLFTVTGDFKTEDLVKAAEKSGVGSVKVVSVEEFPPKEKEKPKEAPKDKEAPKEKEKPKEAPKDKEAPKEKAKEEKTKDEKASSKAIVVAPAAQVAPTTIPWPPPNSGASANVYVYVHSLNVTIGR